MKEKTKKGGKEMPTALLSVYHKEGILKFAWELVELGWEIIASGGTAKTLAGAGISVRDVASLVGGGPILGHRVVTLSREVHAGLLARNTDIDIEELERLGLPRIDLVCVDLYPLKEEIKKPDSTLESVIEQTDIGGPTMLRSAAKGNRIVICEPVDWEAVINWLQEGKPEEDEFIADLAAKAEGVVAGYCLTSARYRSGGAWDGIIGRQVATCKYGENAWQQPAGLFRTADYDEDPLTLDKFKLIAGTSPSYNNLCDIDRLLQTITHIAAAFDLNRQRVPLIAVAVKHGNPCGAAIGKSRIEVIQKMIIGDRRAIFGGLIMTNFKVDETVSRELLHYLMDEGQRRLLDGIVAPSFSRSAIQMLQRKNDKCRLLTNPALDSLSQKSLDSARRFRPVRGGFLCQPNYTFALNLKDPQLVKISQLSPKEEDNLLLAWAIGSTSNSNTITLVKDGYLIGNGVGQQDRVSCCVLAIRRAREAGHDTYRAVAYSDSFFPFADGPLALANAGVNAILASSGSVNDGAVKELCQKSGVVLYLIPDSVGRGFFGH